jgi:1-aminocyclopropane-1-carboxylate deaminase
MKIKTQEISFSLLKQKEIRLFIKRIDQIHKHISGNKWFKLKYNLIEAKNQGAQSILTFGGAYSNHIAATAFLAKENGFTSIGIIRGEEQLYLNPTLEFAIEQGMKINYVSRSDYRLKHTVHFLEKLKIRFGDFYLIPEGGTNQLAIKGATEILDKNDTQDFICCAVGTGGTIAGIINATNEHQEVIGFPAIKGFTQLEKNTKSWVNKNNFKFINNYYCGGYAKLTNQLIECMNNFYKTQNIPLDAIYTGKMMLGIMDLVAKDYFPKGSSILAIHSGGLQGNKGMNQRFECNFPTN